VRQPALHTDIVYFAIDPAIGACATTAGPLAPGLAFSGFQDKRITSPEVTHEQKPQYTQDAMNRHVEGTAWVRATVMPQGCVSEASIIRPLDPGLDVQAMRAVANWKFRPALLDGQPVPVDVVIEVSFTFKK